MKIRFTEKGASLIVLVIIIVVVGTLGTGIVSFMGAKQKSYPLQAQSYQALNLANAGIEFAIRYASEDVSRFNAPGSVLRTGVTVNYGNGSFTIQFLNDPPNYALKSVGVCGNAQREVRLKSFPGYTTGDGFLLTKTYDGTQAPAQQSQNVAIPLTNLYDVPIYVKNMEITLNPTQGSGNRIQILTFGGIEIYNYINQTPQSDWTNPNFRGSGANRGICIPESDGSGCTGSPTALTPARIPYAYNLNLQIPPGSMSEILNFNSASVRGTYMAKFYYDFDTSYSNLQTATMTFTIN